jgi:hypothetical protein
MRYICAVALSFVAQLPIAHAQDVCEFEDAVIIADDYTNTYLGSITDKSDAQSIFNENGVYGRANSLDSIWNTNGVFGSEHSVYSPRNPRTPSPPMILKDGKVVAYLTVNMSIERAISLASLTGRCSE